MRVLYVEDEPFVRRDFARIMAAYATVVAVGTMQRAFAELRGEGSWGAFIFDLDLGASQSGWDLVAEATRLHPSTPRLIVTAAFSREIFHQATAAGTDYLDKLAPAVGLERFLREANEWAIVVADVIADIVRSKRSACGLTKREAAFLEAELNGHARRKYLDGKRISKETEKSHRRHLLQKFRATDLLDPEAGWDDLHRLMAREISRTRARQGVAEMRVPPSIAPLSGVSPVTTGF